MNYLHSEEKLINEQLRLTKKLKQTELLNALDKSFSSLSTRLRESITGNIVTMESLSVDNKLELPLRIKGNMLGVGRHKVRYYTAEELKKSVDKYNNKKIKIKLDHRRNEVSSTVGAVDKIYWSDEEQLIKYEGHINDETVARNILDGVITEVSASIDSMLSVDSRYGIVGLDPEYPELSLVEEGAYKQNSLVVA
jgi:hypothetical protein